MQETLWIHEFLREARVPYGVFPHRPAFTATAEAMAVAVPWRAWAKVVIFVVDGRPVQAVVPARLTVNPARLLELTGGTSIRLAEEDELCRLFPDCEPGAMPPFGMLYGQPVYVDVALAGESEIFFNAGTHTEAMSMRWSDFAASVRPIVAVLADWTPMGFEAAD